MISNKQCKRPYCTGCGRLAVNCLCEALCQLENWVEVVVVQHPLEANNVKGTAKLAQACLQNARLIVAEVLSAEQLSDLFDGEKQVMLLYPITDDFEGEQVAAVALAQQIQADPMAASGLKVVVIDATWKKSRKMLYLNPTLAALPRIALAPWQESGYRIRKQKNAQSLSSLEAIAQLLGTLEQQPQKYAPLLNVLDALVAQQLRFLPNRD